jgi:sulfhydrogenase subunit beta (sulfur reductase)
MVELMNTYNLHQENVPEFIEHLRKSGTVYAPHAKGETSFVFQEVENAKDVILNYTRTLHSIKKYFLPSKEQLLQFSLRDQTFKGIELDDSSRIFVGVHSYDLQAVLKLDYNFSQGNPEQNYLKRRENCGFIGVSYEPDEFHFSQSVGIAMDEKDGFDIYLKRHSKGYLLDVITDHGNKMIKGFTALEPSQLDEDIAYSFKNKLKFNYNRIPEVFDHTWNSSVWRKVSERCVGCGTCNLVCPTCFCFDVEDDLELSLEGGVRERVWDGCMLESFAAVAGGENFRESLADRQRHRIYRKFKYITDITGEPWCVGCGRCAAYCTAGISIVEIVNDLCEEYEREHLIRPVEQPGIVAEGRLL